MLIPSKPKAKFINGVRYVQAGVPRRGETQPLETKRARSYYEMCDKLFIQASNFSTMAMAAEKRGDYYTAVACKELALKNMQLSNRYLRLAYGQATLSDKFKSLFT